MDLLIAQFNLGPLSLDEIKTVLGADFGSSWPTLQKKFVKGKDDLYFNERLQSEKEKRSSYTASRRKNAKHMLQHMENENEDVNTNTNSFIPGQIESAYLTFGEFKKVLLTQEEYNALIARLGQLNADILISELDSYIASLGAKGEKKYANHAAVLKNWARRKIQDHQKAKLPAKTRTIA